MINLHFMAAGAEQETAWIGQDYQEKSPAYFWAALKKGKKLKQLFRAEMNNESQDFPGFTYKY